MPAVHAAEQPCREAWDRPPRRGARQGLSWELSAIAGPGSSLVDERPPWCRRKTSWAAVASPRTEPRAPFPPGGQPSLWFCSKTLTRVQGAARCKSQLTSASESSPQEARSPGKAWWMVSLWPTRSGGTQVGAKCLPQGPVSTSPDSVGYQWVRELGSLCPELQDTGAGPTHGSRPVYRWLLAEPGDVFRQTVHLGQSL